MPPPYPPRIKQDVKQIRRRLTDYCERGVLSHDLPTISPPSARREWILLWRCGMNERREPDAID
jgi:hypothetical protein